MSTPVLSAPAVPAAPAGTGDAEGRDPGGVRLDRRPHRGPSVSVRLLALVLVALLPTVLVLVYVAQSWRAASEDDAAASVRRLAEAAALQQDNVVRSAGQVLQALAVTDSVVADRSQCPAAMRSLAADFPQFAVVGVADAAGDFWCSSRPLSARVSVIDRDYFLEARATRRPTVGTYQIGRVTGKPTVAVAHPLLTADGSFAGAVIGSLDLSRPIELVERLDLPTGSTVTVFDRDDTVLMRWPSSDRYLGRSFSEHAEAIRDDATVRTTGLDGVERVYGAARVGGSGQDGLTLAVGVPVAHVESAATTALSHAVGSFVGIALGAGALALLLGRATVVRPVRRLRRATQRLAAGDLTTRAGFSGGGDLSSLAADFDVMAVALQEREQELRLAEQRAVEERYQGLLEVAADGVLVVDGDGRVVLLNRGAETMFGTSVEQAHGRPHHEVLGTSLLGQARTLFSWTSPDGGLRWAEAHGSQGSDGLTTVIVRDVTDAHRARRAEADLRERDERFRVAQAHSAIGMALVGLEGRWIEVNPALCRIVGRSEQELLALTFQDITHPDDLDADLEQVRLLLAGETDGYEMEKRYRHADGHDVWIQLNATLVRDDEGAPQYFVVQIQDITADRARKLELEQRRAELERSNAELEQFAYVASHDLSEPLRSISGFAALLEDDLKDRLDEESRQYLQYMVAGTHRMQALINDLLAFSRVTRSSLRFAAVDLGPTVDDVLAVLDATRSETGAVVRRGDLPVVQANRTLMTQLFQNLISNALKFRRAGVAPVVRVELRGVADGYAEIVVEDNGIGIEEKYRERVFGMFQRLHARSEYDGTGMGLAVCAKIVDSLGGRIWIEDSPLGGASLHLTLPLAQS